MRVGRNLAVAASATVMLAGLATSADAVWVRPSSAPLLDAAGHDSGCDATVAAMSVNQQPNGDWAFVRSGQMVCDRSWPRMRISTGLDEVMPDGSVQRLIPLSSAVVGTGPTADVPTGVETVAPCESYPGTHTFVYRMSFKVKTSRTDTNPYKARVDRKTTITCPV